MKTQINNTPTETRKFSFFSNFKSSKRVVWTQRRNFSF